MITNVDELREQRYVSLSLEVNSLILSAFNKGENSIRITSENRHVPKNLSNDEWARLFEDLAKAGYFVLNTVPNNEFANGSIIVSWE